jgi:cytochrome P450
VIEKLPRHLPLLTRPLVNSFLVDKRTCNRVAASDNWQQPDVRVVPAMTATVPPLFGSDMLTDPYAMYARVRGPIAWNEQMGLWLVTRYDDVRWALGEPRLSSTMPSPAAGSADGSSGLLADMYTFVKSSLVFTDPPDHTRLRRLVIAAFVPSVINDLSGPIAAITNRMLDEHADSLDLAAHLAEPMPIAVLGQLLGVSLSEPEGAQLKQWCDDFLLPFGRDINTLSSDELARVKAAGEGLHGFVDTVLSRRTANGTDDVVGRLLAGESEDRLSEQELFANIVLLLIAGHENSTSLIGNGAAMLLGLSDVRAELARDPSRWPAAIEELMRLVTPNQFIRRLALEDIARGDHTIRAGDAVLLTLAAANRDPKHSRSRIGSSSIAQTDKPSHLVTASTTALARRWRGSKAASPCRPCSSGGRLSAKLGIWFTPTTSTCVCCIRCRLPRPERAGIGEILSRPGRPAG